MEQKVSLLGGEAGEHASADLWVMPQGTKSFEDTSLIDEQQRFRALSIKEVTAAVPVVIGFAQWRLPSGGKPPCERF